jgi:hypothetical protein
MQAMIYSKHFLDDSQININTDHLTIVSFLSANATLAGIPETLLIFINKDLSK